MTKEQIQAIKCAHADLKGSAESYSEHDWKAHKLTIEKLEQAFPEILVDDQQAEATKITPPLWRVLNEQRTQGEWKHKSQSNGHEEIITDAFVYESGNTIFEVNYQNKDYEANAQYTALAVNNLASLAEALEAIHERSLNLLVEVIDIPYPTSMNEDISKLRDAIKLAKEALNRIK